MRENNYKNNNKGKNYGKKDGGRPARNENYNSNNKKQYYKEPVQISEEEIGGLVIGRNAVRELLKSGRAVDKLLVSRGDREGSIVVLVAQAIERGIPVVEVERQKLDGMAGMSQHQGVIAMAAEKEYVEVEDIIAIARERGEAPLIVISDGITDPYNLGALIRCAEGVGAHGLIIPKRRASGLTPLVSKSPRYCRNHSPRTSSATP